MPKSPNTPDNNLSDELLNSFIDRQITNEERQEVLSILKQDESLANRTCELQRIKEMTQLAYDDIPPSALKSPRQPSINRLPQLAAAVAIFCLGILLGLGMIKVYPEMDSFTQLAGEHSQTKVLVHLTSADLDSGMNTLDNIEQMLLEYQRNQQPVVVEVVANGNGIKLLSTENQLIAMRVALLTQQHENLTFAACKNTIDQMKLSKGLDMRLIPQVKLIDSGVVNVIKRQTQGWTYIRG